MSHNLQQKIKHVLEFYSTYTVLNKRQKTIGITAAIMLSLIYLVREKLLKPPKNLRHIPYISYFSIIRSLFTGESNWDRFYRVVIPHIDSPQSNGLYLV